MQFRTPLAWKNLIEVPSRFVVSCGAIGFAVVLMFMQSGFRNALLDSPVQITEHLGGDLVALSPARYAIAIEQRFPSRLLQRVAAHPAVSEVTPLYIEKSVAFLRVPNKPAKTIRVVGIPPHTKQVDDPSLAAQLPRLRAPQSAIIDRRSKATYGLPVNDPEALPDTYAELMGQSLKIVGHVEIGVDFAHDGNLLISDASMRDYFPFRGNGDPLSITDMAIIRLRPGYDPQQVAKELSKIDSSVLQVVTRKQLENSERQFWASATPIGIIFTAGMWVGFSVGVIICYQILFTDIHDHMSEFATLKAMGYRGTYFIQVVCQQAWLLATFGFLPGWLLSWVLFMLLQFSVGLPMMMTIPRVLIVLGLTVGMCTIGGMLAMRNLLRADPAKLF